MAAHLGSVSNKCLVKDPQRRRRQWHTHLKNSSLVTPVVNYIYSWCIFNDYSYFTVSLSDFIQCLLNVVCTWHQNVESLQTPFAEEHNRRQHSTAQSRQTSFWHSKNGGMVFKPNLNLSSNHFELAVPLKMKITFFFSDKDSIHVDLAGQWRVTVITTHLSRF